MTRTSDAVSTGYAPTEGWSGVASVAVDEQGALLVANSEGGVIDVFKGKDHAPTRVIKTGAAKFAHDCFRATRGCPLRIRCLLCRRREAADFVGLRWAKADEHGCGLGFASGKRLRTLRGSSARQIFDLRG